MDQNPFVPVGTGKSNIFKKRKRLASRINAPPPIILQDTIHSDGLSPDEEAGFDDYGAFDDVHSVTSDSNEIPPDREEVPFCC